MDFLDTSVLVAAFDASDDFHRHAWALFERQEGRSSIAVHTLAEVFSVLTGRRGVKPGTAFDIIRTNTSGLKKISLTPAEYLRTMEDAESRGIRGGAIYDSLILACARKGRATTIWTFNTRHFLLFADDLKNLIRDPAA